MASEITHVFGVLGTSLVIQTGCCSALADETLAGDIICATSAGCGEGAAQYYLPQKNEIPASPEPAELVSKEKISGVAFHKGPIWTTSALLAEGIAEIQGWSNKGYIAVDMETASTFAVAEYFKMQRISLLFVFDNPRQGEHILLTDVEKHERRVQGEQIMINTVFSIVEDYGNTFNRSIRMR